MMYASKLILYFLLPTLVLLPHSVSSSSPTYANQDVSLSTQMLKSIISRGQGLALSTGKNSLIERGIFQSALRQSLAHAISSADCTTRNAFETYLEQSTESTLGLVSNGTADVGLPLDRLSVGTGILEQ